MKRTLLLSTATGEQGTGGAKDQSDILAQNETLKQQLADANAGKQKLEGEKTTLTTQLSEANGKVTKLESENATLTQANTKLGSEKAELQAANVTLTNQVANLTKERDTFKAQAEPIQKQLAAKLAAHGIRATAVEVPREKDGQKLTATERVKLAKGQV